MGRPQRLQRKVEAPDLGVSLEEYFGAHPDEARNTEYFGVTRDPRKEQELYRVSYLFLLVFGSNDQDKIMDNEYGGMQLRAECFLWAEDGQIPIRMQKIVQNVAHRAAHCFNSSVAHRGYAMGPGYLEGFDPWEAGAEYDNWEIEPVGRSEVHNPPGVIDWTTEIYLDVDTQKLEYAQLSGVGSGLASPYQTRQVSEPGEPAVDIPSTKWHIGFEDAWGDYYARPEPGTKASSRYLEDGAGGGKEVLVNGLKVGSLGPKGRVRINPEYQRGDGFTHGDNHSRAGLIAKSDDATPQALRKGGRLYQTGETENEVHLVTARAKPEGWSSADPDQVPVDLEASSGREAREFAVMSVQEPDEPILIDCRQDREVIKHLGYSDGDWTVSVGGEFRHPSFREVRPHHIDRDEPDRDDGQAGLDSYGGGGS